MSIKEKIITVAKYTAGAAVVVGVGFLAYKNQDQILSTITSAGEKVTGLFTKTTTETPTT